MLIACKNNNTEIVRALLAAGADPNMAAGNTVPLVIALTNRNNDMMKLLIQAGASFTVSTIK